MRIRVEINEREGRKTIGKQSTKPIVGFFLENQQNLINSYLD